MSCFFCLPHSSIFCSETYNHALTQSRLTGCLAVGYFSGKSESGVVSRVLLRIVATKAHNFFDIFLPNDVCNSKIYLFHTSVRLCVDNLILHYFPFLKFNVDRYVNYVNFAQLVFVQHRQLKNINAQNSTFFSHLVA